MSSELRGAPITIIDPQPTLEGAGVRLKRSISAAGR